MGLYRLQVGVAPALVRSDSHIHTQTYVHTRTASANTAFKITLQNYKRSIEFICVDAYFSNLYFYDRVAKQVRVLQSRNHLTGSNEI